MTSKNISLREEAYERLKALKTEGKSFSDVVMELTDEQRQGLEALKDVEIDYTAEDLVEDREEGLTDDRREELLR